MTAPDVEAPDAAVAADRAQGQSKDDIAILGQAHSLIQSDVDADDTRRKALATIKAQLAIRGYALHEIVDGFLICRWNLVKHAHDLRAVVEFARQVGAI